MYIKILKCLWPKPETNYLSQSKPAEVVLIAIVGSVVLIVVNAYMSIELTLISDKVIKSDLVS